MPYKGGKGVNRLVADDGDAVGGGVYVDSTIIRVGAREADGVGLINHTLNYRSR